jgi:hypothetical protein
MNQRNKTKLAVVIPSKKPLDRWYLMNNGLFGALRVLSNKFNIKVFGYSDVPAYIERARFSIQLFDNPSSLRYWLKGFGVKYIIGYGKADDSWTDLTDPQYLQLDKELFVLGLNTGGLGAFSNHVEFYATDTDYFKPLKANKLYPAIFTLPLDNLEQLPPGSVALVHDGEEFVDVINSMHLVNTAPKTPLIFNQAQGVVTNHIETALEAMACNTPVLTTDIDVEGCWKCPKDEISQAYFQMVMSFNNGEIDLRRKYVEHKADHINLAERIKACLL